MGGGGGGHSFGLSDEDWDQPYGGLPDELWASEDGSEWAVRGSGFGGRDLVRGACNEGRRVWIIGGVATDGARGDVWASY